MNKKIVVLDTNVLLHDPEAHKQFLNEVIVIPMQVIEEIDRFKRDPSEKGRNARHFVRWLDSLRDSGDLAAGVQAGSDSNSIIKIAFCRPETKQTLPPELQQESGDNNILAVALEQSRQHGIQAASDVTLISKDINLRLKADTLGLSADDYRKESVALEGLYAGERELITSKEVIDRFSDEGAIDFAAAVDEASAEPEPNLCILLRDATQPGHTALGCYNAESHQIEGLRWLKHANLGRISPRNRQQHFALNLLLNPDVELVTLVGKAGTGKTLLAIAAGLYQVADDKRYARLLVTRPPVSLGHDIGFLPGTLEEKLAPWMQPIIDNLDYLTGSGQSSSPNQPQRGRQSPAQQSSWGDLRGMGLIEIEAINYIRGRSIPHQFLIVDEAQNLTPHEVKTIVTRVGEGTKIVFTGDPYQIDNPYVDAESNGLTWMAERLRGHQGIGHITLTHGERSRLAELAANLL